MTAIPFDTLKFVEHLERSGISHDHAKAEVEALGAALSETFGVKEYATKQDLTELELRINTKLALLEVKIGYIKYDMVKWFAGMMLVQAGAIAALVKLL